MNYAQFPQIVDQDSDGKKLKTAWDIRTQVVATRRGIEVYYFHGNNDCAFACVFLEEYQGETRLLVYPDMEEALDPIPVNPTSWDKKEV